jgi:hypothetical protein
LGADYEWRRRTRLPSVELIMAKRTNDTRTLLEKILEYSLQDINGCWKWQLSKNNIGYGFIRDGSKMRTAHRASYEEHNNVKVPKYTCVIHSCGNYDCVNPSHLFLGSRKDLTNHMISQGRQKFFGGKGGKNRLGMKQPKTECPHCGETIANNVFERWHADNCKQKPVA